MERIITSKNFFKDGQGRTRFFNGMNIDDKHIRRKSFYYDLDETFFKTYVEKGFNLIRLAVTWENLEPSKEKYNESYIRSIDEIFSLAEKYGVYILLDMHQDLYSGYAEGNPGDGAPLWATITDGVKPQQPKFVWAEGYLFGKWVHNAFDHFWNNDPIDGIGLQDRYAMLWQMLAERYGDSPALFGFDIMNEPFPGSDIKAMLARLIIGAVKEALFGGKLDIPSIMGSLLKKDIPGVLDKVGGDIIPDIMKHVAANAKRFDETKYAPFLNKIAAAIRVKTKNGILVIEQQYLCNAGVSQFVRPLTVGGEREPLQCFAPHGYDMTVDTPLYQYAKADRVTAFFDEMKRTSERLDVPVVVGEWGGCSDNTDTSWFPHAFELLDYFDKNKWSQTYWDYHGDDLSSPLMEMLSRTYAVAVAGEVRSYSTDREKGKYSIRYSSDSEGESIFYVHTDAKVDSDGEVRTIEEYPSGAKLVGVMTKPGEHQTEIRF